MKLNYAELPFDQNGIAESPVLELQTLAQKTIGTIPGVSNLKLNIKYSEPSEISFDVASVLDEGEKNPLYDKITGHKVVYTDHYGIYVIMNPSKEGDGVSEVKHVKGYSLEKTLENRKLFLAEGTYPLWDVLDNSRSVGNRQSVLGIALEGLPGWSVGYVDATLYDRYRTFDQYDEYVLSFFYNKVPEKYRCVCVFDPYEKTVNVYDADSEVTNLPIYLDFDNLVENVKVEEISDELVTALRPYGADGLSIASVNPIGTEWLYDFSHFVGNGDMSEALAKKVNEYSADILANQDAYRQLSEFMASAQSKLSTALAKLTELQGELADLETQRYVTIQAINKESGETAGSRETKASLEEQYATINTNIRDKKAEISSLEREISGIQADLDVDYDDSYANKRARIVSRLNIRNYFGDLYNELSAYLIEQDMTEETFVASEISSETPGLFCKYAQDNDGTARRYSEVSVTGASFTEVEGDEDISIPIITGTGGSLTATLYASGDDSETYPDGRLVTSDKIRRCTIEYFANSFTFSLYADGFVVTNLHDVDEVEEHGAGTLTISGTLNGGQSGLSYDGEELSFQSNQCDTYLTYGISDYQKYTVELELYDYAKGVLADLATPTYEFSVDSGNFLFEKEFAPFRRELELGKGVYLDVGNSEVITPYIIEFELDFEHPEKFSLVFSNRFKRKDYVNTLKDMLEASYSTSRSFDAAKYTYNQTAGQASTVARFMNASLDAAKNSVLSGVGKVTIDGGGIHIGSDTDNDQIRLTHNMIAMTGDGWETAKLAIGRFASPEIGEYWGVNADVIAGRLLIGQGLYIESEASSGEVKSFKFDSTGAWLNNSTLIFTHANGGQIMLDGITGLAAGRSIYTVDENGEVVPSFKNASGDLLFEKGEFTPTGTSFYIDAATGKAYFKGDVYAENGVFNGTVYAKDGEFTGKVTATSGEFDGTVKARSFYLSDGTNLKSFLNTNGKIDTDWLTLMGITVTNDSGQEVMTIDQTGIHIKQGEIAWTSDNAPVKYQFGISLTGPWHDAMQSADKYRRDSLDGGITWGSAYQFRGTNGSNGSDANVTFANIKAALQKAAGTESTFITANEVGAPNIYGGNIYGANLYVDGTHSTYAHVGALNDIHASGFYVYMNGNTNPKIALEELADGQFMRLALGAGSDNNSSTANRFFVSKGSTGASIQYFSSSDVECGFSFKDGVITPIGTLQVNAVFA